VKTNEEFSTDRNSEGDLNNHTKSSSLHSLLADILLLKKATIKCQIKPLFRRITNEVKYSVCI